MRTLPIALSCVILLAGLPLAGRQMPPLFIADVTVIDGSGGPPAVRSLVIRGGHIERIVPSGTSAGGSRFRGSGTCTCI